MATTAWRLTLDWGEPTPQHELVFIFEDNGTWSNVYERGLWVQIQHQPSGQRVRIFTNVSGTKVYYTALVDEDEMNITGIMSHLPAGLGGHFSGAKVVS